MSDANLSQPDGVFAYLIRRTRHRSAVAAGRLFEQHCERSQHDFHGTPAGSLSRLTKLVYHSFQSFKARDPRRVPSISKLRGAIKRVLTEAGDVDRRRPGFSL